MPFMSSQEFASRLQQSRKTTGKTSDSDKPELPEEDLADWLRLFGDA
jgi:hypothetical protein